MRSEATASFKKINNRKRLLLFICILKYIKNLSSFKATKPYGVSTSGRLMKVFLRLKQLFNFHWLPGKIEVDVTGWCSTTNHGLKTCGQTVKTLFFMNFGKKSWITPVTFEYSLKLISQNEKVIQNSEKHLLLKNHWLWHQQDYQQETLIAHFLKYLNR